VAMPVLARRVFRVSLTTALSLAIAYGMALPLPYMAPIFALMLTVTPAPPMGLKSLFGLVLIVLITQGIGLLLIPLLISYPVSAVLIVAVGLYFSTYLTVHKGKGLVGTLLTVGFTLIPAAGVYDFSSAVEVIKGLTLGIGLAIICQRIVYPWLPEGPVAATSTKPVPSSAEGASWVALRVTLIVLPPFLLALINPAMYLKVIMKSVALGQQGSAVNARDAGRELLGSTFLGGCLAIVFWFMLDLVTSLWMFFWWMLVFCIYIASKFYVVIATRYSPSFWQNVGVTMLILLGSAVQDSDGGQDVYAAFALRMGLFVAVTLYAWAAVYLLEQLRTRRLRRLSPSVVTMETY
jgi:hypothetical protein